MRVDDVYIRLEVITPPPTAAQRKEECLGVELGVTKVITLRRDLSDIKVYDSGLDPPELRWPE